MGKDVRRKLITRWQALLSAEEEQAEPGGEQFHQAENIIDSVIGAGLVPPLPVFILTILQIARSGNAAIGTSSYGYYYERIIKDSLSKITGEGNLEYYLDYLSELAGHIDKKGTDTLGQEELSSLESDFVSL